MKVYVVLGTLDSCDCPDYEIHGVFKDKDKAIDHAIKIATSAMNRMDMPMNHRECETIDGSKTGYVFGIFDNTDWYVIINVVCKEVEE